MSYKELFQAKRIAFDIEIADNETLSCVAFAASPHKAYVFDAARREEIGLLLQSEVPKVAQNGKFDTYFLRTRCDLEVNCYEDDTIVAWHACYPELAGASQDRRGGSKRTRKGLAFLASLFTRDAWWKDYDFQSAEDEMVLCGRDACITLDVMQQLDVLIDKLDVRAIYEHQMRLIEPCITMQERGLNVDEQVRIQRLQELGIRSEAIQADILPLVERRLQDTGNTLRRRNLFWKQRTCSCCRGGKGKVAACWSCAGFDKKPGKRALAASGVELKPCAKCEGVGKWEVFEFNPNSNDQKAILLYDVLKLPRRKNVDEETLKGLLAQVQDETN